jgi:hypothetical protein
MKGIEAEANSIENIIKRHYLKKGLTSYEYEVIRKTAQRLGIAIENVEWKKEDFIYPDEKEYF